MPTPHRDLRIRIFFSSPGDVEDEWEIAQDVIDELQRFEGEELGVNLIFKGWETHTYPAIGRPQGVINQQIGNYEIFVGVFWNRYGSPTGEAESGTVEEFKRALENRDQNGIPAVLFYFRETPANLDTIEKLEQKMRVVQFRERYGEEAGLYKTYDHIDEFETELRQGLIATIRRVRRRLIAEGGIAVDSAVQEASVDFDASVDVMGPKEFVAESLEVVAEGFESFAHIDLDDDIRVEIDREDSTQAFTATIYKGDDVVNKCKVAKSEHRRQHLLVCMIGAKAARTARGQPEMVKAHVAEEQDQLCFRVTSQSFDPPEENIDGHELAQYLWNALTAPLEYHSPARALVGAFQWTSK